jgi:ABC-type oligopeptide transport system ATPase subunit
MIVGAPLRLQKVQTELGIKRTAGSAEPGRLNPEHYNRYPHEFSGASGSGSASPGRWRCGRSSIIADEPVSALTSLSRRR